MQFTSLNQAEEVVFINKVMHLYKVYNNKPSQLGYFLKLNIPKGITPLRSVIAFKQFLTKVQLPS